MSTSPEWFDPATGRLSGEPDADLLDPAERAERAARADTALSVHAALAALTASVASAASATEHPSGEPDADLLDPAERAERAARADTALSVHAALAALTASVASAASATEHPSGEPDADLLDPAERAERAARADTALSVRAALAAMTASVASAASATEHPSGEPDGDLLGPAERAERAARADTALSVHAALASLTASVASAAATGAVLVPDTHASVEVVAPEAALGGAPAADAVPSAENATLAASYSSLRLAGGVLGRMVLAFVGGCLAVTLLPLVLGWHPYVVESASMAPRIKVGDIVLASPDQDPRTLLGHVTVFADPALPGQVKSHRVIAVNPDGSMTTKGDANPTADRVAVQPSEVKGIGRLLVRWAGLPLVWAQTGLFLFLGLFLLALGAAAWAVARDHEDEDDEEDENAERDRDSGELAEPPTVPVQVRRVAQQRWARRRRTATIRAVFGLVAAGTLAVPGTSAAFSATTKNTTASWAVPAYSYTTTANSYVPYLYWKLDDIGAVAADASGNFREGTYAGTYTRGVVGGTPDTAPNTAVAATATTTCISTKPSTAITAPAVFTAMVWFKTTSGYDLGGKLIAFESPRIGVGGGPGGSSDRHIYLDGAGKIWFGVVNSANESVSTAATYNDGSWHMAVATISPAGMALYVDGVLRGTDTNTVAESGTGWWRVGCGNLSGWGAEWTGPNSPGTGSGAANRPFLGSLDEAAIYDTALTAAEISYLYWTR